MKNFATVFDHRVALRPAPEAIPTIRYALDNHFSGISVSSLVSFQRRSSRIGFPRCFVCEIGHTACMDMPAVGLVSGEGFVVEYRCIVRSG